ncbi:MAG: S1 RNA-binding domain-containing protein [bacterium]
MDKDNKQIQEDETFDFVQKEEFKPTKIGAVSEFEKSLNLDETSTEKETKTKPKKQVKTDIVKEKIAKENLFEQQIEQTVIDYQEGDIIKGVITKIEKSGIFLDINYKSEGFVPMSEVGQSLAKKLMPGEELSVYIEKLENKEGCTMLSRKKALYEENWETLLDAMKHRTTVEIIVNSSVKGGLVASYEEIKGFIPASQVQLDAEQELGDFKNKTLRVIPLQADRKRRKIIFSHKQAENTTVEKVAVDLDSFEMGQIRVGKVTSIKDFGVFVDVGGIEGLVHISELSWSRINHPSELVNIGEELDVFILGVNKTTGRISLGVKQLQPDPWVEAAQKYELGQVVQVKVTRIVNFGIFVELEEHLEGLIHISELSQDHIQDIQSFAKEDDVLEAKIIKMIPDEQKIGLSIKQIKRENQKESQEGTEEDRERKLVN